MGPLDFTLQLAQVVLMLAAAFAVVLAALCYSAAVNIQVERHEMEKKVLEMAISENEANQKSLMDLKDTLRNAIVIGGPHKVRDN